MPLAPIEVLDLVTLIANVGVVISLVFIVYQIILQRRELKYSVYEKLMSDFSNATLLLVDHPELRRMYAGRSKPRNWDKYDDGKKALYCYFDSLFGLLERVWVSYKEMKLMKRKDWGSWKNWIKELAENEIFIDVFNDNQELYDISFISEVQRIITAVNEGS